MLSTVLWTIAAVAGGYLILILLVYTLQDKLIYHPVSDLTYTPAMVGLKYEDVNFTSDDGVTLHGWYVPHESPKGTILFQHGNAGNIAGRVETLRLLNSLGVNVFIYDYRGYGQSEGSPSERGTYSDAMAAWRYLTQKRMQAPDRIVLMGRSLGGAVTAWLATQVQPAGVIVESTFTSAPDLAAELYPIFPARRLIKFNYPNKLYLKDVKAPILVAHSTEDDLIPFHHGQELFELANEPKRFFEMKGDHGNGFMETGEPYRNALNQFITDVLETEAVQKDL